MYISERDKERIWSYYIKRYTIQEIANKTNIPVTTVHYHIKQLRTDREELNNLAKEFEAEFNRIRQVLEEQNRALSHTLDDNKNLSLAERLKIMDMIKEREEKIWDLIGDGEIVMWVRNLNGFKDIKKSKGTAREKQPDDSG